MDSGAYLPGVSVYVTKSAAGVSAIGVYDKPVFRPRYCFRGELRALLTNDDNTSKSCRWLEEASQILRDAAFEHIRRARYNAISPRSITSTTSINPAMIRAFLCSWREKNKLGFLPFSGVA